MLKKTSLIILSLCLIFTINAQDTLRVMVYNLLYYGVELGSCSFSNNNPNAKDGHLRNILSYDLPDIFVVNEISRNPVYHDRIIDSVFNLITNTSYERAETKNVNTFSSIMNMLYYNTEKLELYSQHIVQSLTRDIDLYTLYYKSPDLENGDTAFINCLAAHLKAGSSPEDQLRRTHQINNVLAWLANNRPPGNYLFMGDFNAKSSNEQAMQNLFFNPNPDFRFYDPVEQLGNWYNNPQFTFYHTQSTHTSGPCHSGGGMDDRFDLIIATQDILQGNKMVSYIEGSYFTMGQDGNRLKKSLIDTPTNTSAPYPVIQSLYHNSDHLPVLLSLAVNQTPASTGRPAQLPGIKINNPVENELRIRFTQTLPGNEALVLSLYNSHGQLLEEKTVHTSATHLSIPMHTFSSGLYVLRLQNSRAGAVYKIIKL